MLYTIFDLNNGGLVSFTLLFAFRYVFDLYFYTYYFSFFIAFLLPYPFVFLISFLPTFLPFWIQWQLHPEKIFFPRYSGIGIHSYRTRLLVVVVTCCKLIPPLQTAIEMCGNNFGLEYFSAI